ncbi:hypothetical protein [Acidipropionibacterium jensenii]|nr:hypothetical protein [Acidipropionibacterium jensenii]MDN5976382.1 hypothetical protein [Acidipropionibacterium jensenii]MDN5995590.1 hypothetical protein [Acidipropionibacterium jensenii]MDN6425668.1 hypothetical protein [Acidipropionibacterium jensenii]MDN6440580.1 hypothetical protein [Acidipropionibacterium jensenii]MDN6479448.1 hypothetical protein [Acidipropionibacterium jensenii]
MAEPHREKLSPRGMWCAPEAAMLSHLPVTQVAARPSRHLEPAIMLLVALNCVLFAMPMAMEM